MQFTRLRLIGFKTFVEPTEFVIEPGLTGLVGPNGCGKSNLVEALRWVMGETSHKALRAQDMDEVIFSGSNIRPARNMAEVILSIDNTDRTAPASFNTNETLEVSRRIEREAGSAYRINGREVRARDVQLLFADASSGARSPALVRQGQIGEIINAKPESRRRILEEAAGVAGLHARKHEAETRLKAAEHNLQRLEDVITQIQSQRDGLKRQARQTMRYRTVSANIRKQQAILAALRWREAETAVTEAERTFDLAVREVAERTRVQGETNRAREQANEQLSPLREKEAATAAGLQRLTLASSDLDREEGRAKARAEELERRLVQLTQDVERERSLAADARDVLMRLSGEEAALIADTKASENSDTAARERLAGAEAVLAKSEQAFAEATAALADLAARRDQIDRTMQEAGERIARLESEIAEIDRETSLLKADKDGDLERLGAEAAAAQKALAEADANALRAEAARSASAQALDAVRRPLTQADQQLHRLETEARTLAKLLDVAEKKLWPPVLDTIRVEPGFEAALGAALGDDLDAPTEAAAPMHWAGAQPASSDPALPAGVEPLSAHVTAPPALARRIAQIGIIARADGPRLCSELAPGQRLVSHEGDLWRWDGFTVAAEAQTAAARRLAARNRLAELDNETGPARIEAHTLAETATRTEAELRAAETAEAEARTVWRAAQAAFDAARETLALAERKANERQARLSALAEAYTRLAADRDETAATMTEAKNSRSALSEAGQLEHRLEEIRLVLTQDRTAAASARAELEGIERERAAHANRLTAISTERAAWNEREKGAATRLKAIEDRLVETRNERSALENAPATFAGQRNNLLSQIAEAEGARRAAGDLLAENEAALTDAERAARAALEMLSSAREESARAEARLEAARERRADLAREITEVLGGPPEPARIAEILDGAGETDAAAVESELQRLNEIRERLGAVNLRAEEELREVEAQHEGLTSERDDLIEAIKRLRQGISNLDREARARLSASFAVVNDHFRKLFTGLFGGGNAELILTNSDDPLEAGLDIIAKPPGKKPQTLSLLSGGEQALTALALIFAVFLTNPAPVCVLDEVDAPLDDSNVERFCNLLDEMTKLTATRFLVVTHNPITMSRMNRLFGVTMAELGMSQMVSVDLETAQSIRAA